MPHKFTFYIEPNAIEGTAITFSASETLAADPAVNLAWDERTFPDEPVIQFF